MTTPKKTKILIIDDDEDYRASTRALLESSGYEVSEANCGREGLKAALEQMPALIVLDIMMDSPVEGYTVNQAIRHRDEYSALQDVPILMVSSVPLDPSARFPMTAEAEMITPDAYMTKPLNVTKFLELVQKMTSE